MQQCYHWICIQQHQSDTLCPCVCILWLTVLFWLMAGQPQLSIKWAYSLITLIKRTALMLSVVKVSVLTHKSTLYSGRNMVWAPVKSNDLTACLSALLSEDECAGEALEGSSLPVRRHKEWGLQGCSYLLHHLIPGEFVVADGGCRNRKYESMNYLMLSNPILTVIIGSEWVSWLLDFSLMMGLFLFFLMIGSMLVQFPTVWVRL